MRSPRIIYKARQKDVNHRTIKLKKSTWRSKRNMRKMVLHKLRRRGFQEGLKQLVMSNPNERSSCIKTEKRCLENNKGQ